MTEPYDFSTLEGRLRWLIEEHLGTTYASFAGRLGVAKSQLSRWVNHGGISEENFEAIADEGHVRVPWLRYGVGEPNATARSALMVRERGAEFTPAEVQHTDTKPTRHEGKLELHPEDPYSPVAPVPGAERLKGRAREIFDGWCYELRGRGLSEEVVTDYAREALGPIARGETRYHGANLDLSEEDQIDVLETLIPILRRQLQSA